MWKVLCDTWGGDRGVRRRDVKGNSCGTLVNLMMIYLFISSSSSYSYSFVIPVIELFFILRNETKKMKHFNGFRC